jgi:hypothetical protein
MSTSSIKKVSAAAVAVVLGITGLSHAAPVQLPYFTSFQTTPDSNGDTYAPGQLEGQGHNNVNIPSDSTSTGWVDETGEPTNVATVLAAGAGVQLNAAPGVGSLAGAFSDVYNSNLADHPAAGSNGNGIALTPPVTGLVNIDYNMKITAPTIGNGLSSASGTNSFSKAGFGVEVLNSNDQVLASLFAVSNPAHAGEVDAEVNESQGNQKTDPILVPPADGVNATYSIDLHFNTQSFTVFINGTQGGTYQFANASTAVGGIAFATDNLGTDQAVFTNLSVVPEPASLAMIGLGGAMLLIRRRPKRLA